MACVRGEGVVGEKSFLLSYETAKKKKSGTFLCRQVAREDRAKCKTTTVLDKGLQTQRLSCLVVPTALDVSFKLTCQMRVSCFDLRPGQ